MFLRSEPARTRTRTSWPAARSRRTTAEPTNPVAPVMSEVTIPSAPCNPARGPNPSSPALPAAVALQELPGLVLDGSLAVSRGKLREQGPQFAARFGGPVIGEERFRQSQPVFGSRRD